MNYMFCPKCQKVQPAFFDRSKHIVCSECRSDFKVKQFCCKQCHDCGSLLYAPPAALESSVFPCLKEHMRQKEAQRAAAENRKKEEEKKQAEDEKDIADTQAKPPVPEMPAADKKTEIPDDPAPAPKQDSAYPAIPCETCGKPLPFSSEAYGTCVSCGKTPSQTYIHRQLYQMHGPMKPIQYKWNPTPLELLHVAEMSDAIPIHSVLIVGDQQEAYYFAGGDKEAFHEEGTYPLFDDPRTEDEIIKAMYLGNASEDSIAYRLNTRILFLDMHKQKLFFRADFSLLNGGWLVSLPFDLDFQICESENLLRNQLDFDGLPAFAEKLIRQIKMEVKQEMSERLLRIPTDKLAEAENEESVRRVLSEVLDQETEAVRQNVNRQLVQRLGLQIVFLRVPLISADFINTTACNRVVCPTCKKALWVEKGSRPTIQCSECGTRLRWCFMCRAVTPSVMINPNTEECTVCGHVKI